MQGEQGKGCLGGAHQGRLPFIMALLMGLFLGACVPAVIPPPESLFVREVQGEVFDITPVRGALKPLLHRRGSFEYKCTECHNDFTSAQRQNAEIPEHAKINAGFDHGLNTFCVNCHHPTDRSAYVAHDGSVIPSTDPALLCSKCHGPTYREWQVGIHGRQNGSWERDNPARTKLLCIQCHDPHQPKFAPMTPDPPTIRSRFDTGAGHGEEHAAAEKQNPDGGVP